MELQMSRIRLVFVLGIFLVFFGSCSDNTNNVQIQDPIDANLKITFVELGSESCIPCQKMRPVMDSIQKKYGSQILVKFIDVIKNSKEAEPYKIRVMPTQVFFDTTNTEINRHEGFYPEDSIHVFLQSKGLKILSN
jgi:thioredoxin 1